MTIAEASVRGIGLEVASRIVEVALRIARAHNLRPMTIVVLDSGGDPVAFKREDGTGIRRYEVAAGKAFGALVMNRSSRAIGVIGDSAPMFIQSLTAVTAGRMVPTPGGVLVKNAAGLIIGAVGSSGDDPDADEACAIEAVREAGLFPEPEQPASKRL